MNIRIDLAIQFIENHYNSKLVLDEIAKNAFISPYHFHRIFQAQTGLTPKEYQEKIRLEHGAHLLHVSDLLVADIAFEVGYENQETFIRRFKKSFGLSPEKFRKKKNISKLLEIKSFNLNRLKIVQTNTEFRGVIEIKEKIPILSLRHKGSYDKLSLSWREFVKSIQKVKKLYPEDTFYGIVHSNPDVSSEEELFFDLCYQADSVYYEKLKQYQSKLIPSGAYACFRYKGKFEYFDILYPYIYANILGALHLKLRDGVSFEKYIQNPIFFSEKNCITEIYIPVEES